MVKKNHWYLGLILSAISATILPGQILPPPQVIQYTQGFFRSDTIALTLPPLQQREGLALTEPIAEVFFISSDARCSVHCSLDPMGLGLEAYRLTIATDKILIQADHAKGLFYGLQSLAQLRRYHSDGQIPCQVITDEPVLAHRAVMDDISRGPLSSNDFIRRQIKRLAQYKINALTFYIEDVVRVPSHPTFAPQQGISVEEFAELSRFAAKYNVELIGSFQSLGHFDKILKFPQYKDLGISARMLDPTTTASQSFLLDVYKDMLPHFSSDYFNINGDEAWDLSRGRLLSLADSIGAGRIYSNHITPLLDSLHSYGKRPMMWADILLEHPDEIQRIPDYTVLLPWEYGALTDFSPWLDPLRNGSHEFWVCPGVLNSNRFMPDLDMAATNTKEFIQQGIEAGASGAILTIWDDGGRHFFHRDWLAVAHAATYAWNPQNQLSKDEIDEYWCKTESPDSELGLLNGIDLLHSLKELRSTQNFTQTFTSQVLLPNPGEELTLSLAEIDQVLNVVALALESFRSDAQHPDAPYWTFTAEEIQLLMETKRRVVDWAEKYAEVSFDQTNQAVVHNYLENLIAEITKTHAQWQDLKEDFLFLWRNENRAHWEDEAIAVIDRRLDRLNSLLERINMLSESFDPSQNIFLPSPQAIGLGISASQDNYFSYWLMNGPYRFETFSDSLPDFLSTSGGEKVITPSAGMVVASEQGEFMWTKHQSDLADRIDLRKYYGELKGAASYVYAEITSPNDREVVASFGSNDGITVFLNGEKQFSSSGKRSLQPDEDQTSLQLRKGKNHLTLKISQWKGDWGFSFRLLDQEIRNRKHRYVIE